MVSNCPEEVLDEIQYEVEEMSLTMMNWRQELPFLYGVAREEPMGTVYSGTSVCDKAWVTGDSISSSQASTSQQGDQKKPRAKRGVLNFLWKMTS